MVNLTFQIISRTLYMSQIMWILLARKGSRMEGREGRCLVPVLARELGLEEIEKRFTKAGSLCPLRRYQPCLECSATRGSLCSVERRQTSLRCPQEPTVAQLSLGMSSPFVYNHTTGVPTKLKASPGSAAPTGIPARELGRFRRFEVERKGDREGKPCYMPVNSPYQFHQRLLVTGPGM